MAHSEATRATPFPGTVVITGAGGGVGSALAEELLKAGHRDLLLHYRERGDSLQALAKKYELDPAQNLIQGDLTEESSAEALTQRLGSKPVWGLINLAGASTNSMSWKLSVADFKKVMDSSLLTTFLACRAVIPLMRTQGSGRIINTSSVVAFTGAPGAAHYGAAKAAVVGWSKSIAQELAAKNITVNTIALGYFQYGLINDVSPELQEAVKQRTPIRRFGTAAEIHGLVNYLLSDAGAFTTGQVHHINGGLY